MYSRNFGTFENLSTAKLAELQKNSAARSRKSIPVKTFSDNSAFERFNSLGNDTKSNTDIQINNNNIQPLPENSDISEKVAVEQNISSEVEELQNDLPMKEIKSIPAEEASSQKSFSLFSEIHKLASLIEGDYFIIILAIAMMIFSANETNDKLTPLALLAIMFL